MFWQVKEIDYLRTEFLYDLTTEFLIVKKRR
jgi:hypothetical protein